MVLINCWGLGQGAWIEMHRQHRTNSSMSSTDMIRKLEKEAVAYLSDKCER